MIENESSIAVDIVVPVYNEQLEVVQNTITALAKAFEHYSAANIIIVDDGSDEEFSLEVLKTDQRITFIQHEKNRGYGAALKTGVLTGTAPNIAITDADGTYPIEDLPKLVQEMNNFDMVIGTRTGNIRQIPLLRRFPKMALNAFASYMASTKIKDLNSGMRVFSRELCMYLWGFFPKGFSFTSTLTMGANLGGFRIKEIPINYFKRNGHSSIHPIKDTIRFFTLVSRLGLMFYPTKVFGPVGGILGIAAALKGFFRDYLLTGQVGNVAVMTMLGALQILMLGLLGELIVKSRMLPPRQNKP